MGTKPTAASRQAFEKDFRAAIADMAWWFGWTAQAIDELPLDEFDGWLNEITRQVKAGYRKGG